VVHRRATPAWEATSCRGAALLLSIVLVSLLAVSCGGSDKDAGASKQARPRTFEFSPGEGKDVDIGNGRSLHMLCVGSGTPTVVVIAGVIDDSSTIRDQLGRTTRTCAYDTAGNGYSPALARNGSDLQDLERLLDAAHLRAPYVVVGLGVKSPVASQFAKAHSGETAGVVLVGGVGANWRPRFLALGRGAPADVQRRLRRDVGPARSLGVDWNAVGSQAAGVATLGETPLVVVSTPTPPLDLRRNLPTSLRRAAAKLHMTQQDELAALSSDHQHVVATGADDSLLLTHADVVVQAVRQVVHSARARTRLSRCPEVFRGPGVSCRD